MVERLGEMRKGRRERIIEIREQREDYNLKEKETKRPPF